MKPAAAAAAEGPWSVREQQPLGGNGGGTMAAAAATVAVEMEAAMGRKMSEEMKEDA